MEKNFVHLLEVVGGFQFQEQEVHLLEEKQEVHLLDLEGHFLCSFFW